MKKEYLKPTMQIVLLENRMQLLNVSSVQNNFETVDDYILIDNTPIGDGFYAR